MTCEMLFLSQVFKLWWLPRCVWCNLICYTEDINLLDMLGLQKHLIHSLLCDASFIYPILSSLKGILACHQVIHVITLIGDSEYNLPLATCHFHRLKHHLVPTKCVKLQAECLVRCSLVIRRGENRFVTIWLWEQSRWLVWLNHFSHQHTLICCHWGEDRLRTSPAATIRCFNFLKICLSGSSC